MPLPSKSNLSIKPLLKALARAAFAAVVLFGLSNVASAKGPEFLTITGPGLDQPIDLTDTALVVRLMEQTGLWYATGDLPRPLEEPPAELGPHYTLTWINSGPPNKSRAERTIRQELYLVAGNDLVIHTPDQESLKGWGPGVMGWFTAPSGLWDTFAELGVPIFEATLIGETGDPAIADTTLAEHEPTSASGYLTIVGFALVATLAGALGARRIIGHHSGR